MLKAARIYRIRIRRTKAGKRARAPRGAVFLVWFQPLLVGSRSLLVSVLEAIVVLVDGAVIKPLVALSPGTAVVLLPDLVPQIRFERCLLRLGG